MKTLLLSTLVFLLIPGYSETAEPDPATAALRVTVVDRTNRAEEIKKVVVGAEEIAMLEALFPDYDTRPKGGPAAGWIAQYTFAFELRDGTSVEVMCDGGGDLWTTGNGNGDLRVRGDLKKTLKLLK